MESGHPTVFLHMDKHSIDRRIVVCSGRCQSIYHRRVGRRSRWRALDRENRHWLLSGSRHAELCDQSCRHNFFPLLDVHSFERISTCHMQHLAIRGIFDEGAKPVLLVRHSISTYLAVGVALRSVKRYLNTHHLPYMCTWFAAINSTYWCMRCFFCQVCAVFYRRRCRYGHMPEIRRIAKHRHVPRMIKKAAEAERLQRDKERRKVRLLIQRLWNVDRTMLF